MAKTGNNEPRGPVVNGTMPAWASGRRQPLRRHSRITPGTWLFLALLVVAFVAVGLTSEPPSSGQGAPLIGSVERVTDGDTIVLAGQRIRLIGLDAPEWNQTCRTTAGGDWGCGQAAAHRMRELTRGRSLTCSPQGRDRYGRLLATCRDGDTDLAEALVGEGLAISTGRYAAAESRARASRTGLWQGTFARPAEWRARETTSGGESAGNPSRFERFVNWLLDLFGS